MKLPLFRLLRVMCVLVLATLCLGILVNSGYWNIAVSSFRDNYFKLSNLIRGPGEPTPRTPGEQTPRTPGKPTPRTPGEPTPRTPGKPTPRTPGKPTPRTPGEPTPPRVHHTSLIPWEHHHQPLTSKPLPCNWTLQTFLKPKRTMTFLHCDQQPATISFQEVSSDVTPSVPTLSSDDVPCLKRVIREHCTDAGRRVPRVGHYVRFGSYNMTLDGFLSVLSVVKFLQPCLVLFHGDIVPSGPYWRGLLHLVPNILHVMTERPRRIFKRDIKRVEHSADVARLQLLIEYGGVYADTDHLVLHSLDDFLNRSTVVGRETNNQIGNGFLIAEPGAEFLRIWLSNYTDFQDGQWAVHSTIRPHLLAIDFPHLVRVVNTFFRPNYREIGAYFDRKKTPTYPWSSRHGLHLYTRSVRQYVYGKPRLDKQDHVIADVVRHILYGDQHACNYTK